MSRPRRTQRRHDPAPIGRYAAIPTPSAVGQQPIADSLMRYAAEAERAGLRVISIAVLPAPRVYAI
jgi:hypothetical protein